ncbi:MAG: hypothetical protein M3R17_12365 [Bacteroidota bacterium]|nr:hypothetical protein [Bacteroidota bacterium]
MDQTTIFIIGGSIAFTVIIFFFVFRAAKNKPLTVISEIAEDKNNPGLYHIFGSVTFMPDDAPSFEKYRHYLLDTADLKVIKGLEQIGSDFDIQSPFAIRCVEHMKTISGRDLHLEKEEEDDYEYEDEEAWDAAEARKEKTKLKVIKHDRGESDTSIPKVIKGNVVEVYDTSFGERNQFSLRITLDGMSFSIPKVKGMADIGNVIWRKNQQKIFIFYSRMVMMKFGVGLLVLDTNSGTVLSDDYFKQN